MQSALYSTHTCFLGNTMCQRSKKEREPPPSSCLGYGTTHQPTTYPADAMSICPSTAPASSKERSHCIPLRFSCQMLPNGSSIICHPQQIGDSAVIADEHLRLRLPAPVPTSAVCQRARQIRGWNGWDY